MKFVVLFLIAQKVLGGPVEVRTSTVLTNQDEFHQHMTECHEKGHKFLDKPPTLPLQKYRCEVLHYKSIRRTTKTDQEL